VKEDQQKPGGRDLNGKMLLAERLADSGAEEAVSARKDALDVQGVKAERNAGGTFASACSSWS
jgi:hypothetical protein